VKEILGAMVRLIEGDPELNTLLGASPTVKKLFPHYPPSTETYPCITFYLSTGRPASGNSAEEWQTYILDIWSYNFTLNLEIVRRLDAILTPDNLAVAGRRVYYCEREFEVDLAEIRENQPTVYHKSTRWRVHSLA
jgi:hypothetical protein